MSEGKDGGDDDQGASRLTVLVDSPSHVENGERHGEPKWSMVEASPGTSMMPPGPATSLVRLTSTGCDRRPGGPQAAVNAIAGGAAREDNDGG